MKKLAISMMLFGLVNLKASEGPILENHILNNEVHLTPSTLVSDKLPNAKMYDIGGFNVLLLSGSNFEKGVSYGKLMTSQLNESLKIINRYFVEENGISFERLVKKAREFHEKYPYSYKLFIEGISEGSGLTLDECMILNGMETLNSLLYEKDIVHCTFASIPSSEDDVKRNIITRNYDFPKPFDQCAKYLTVTVIDNENKIPVAFIGMPGQIYCPTCINEKGLFMELNNGMPSGGFGVNNDRETLLVRLLQIMEDSTSLDQIERQLKSTLSDYSLIINVADSQSVFSAEFSSENGVRVHSPNNNRPFVSTNFFQSLQWNTIPDPTDESTWLGVTRRNNLVNLIEKMNGKFDIDDILNIMSTSINDGGSKWELTIYQLVFDTRSQMLYLCGPKSNEWINISLQKMFNELEEIRKSLN